MFSFAVFCGERECSLLLFQDFSSPCRNDAFFTQPKARQPLASCRLAHSSQLCTSSELTFHADSGKAHNKRIMIVNYIGKS